MLQDFQAGLAAGDVAPREAAVRVVDAFLAGNLAGSS